MISIRKSTCILSTAMSLLMGCSGKSVLSDVEIHNPKLVRIESVVSLESTPKGSLNKFRTCLYDRQDNLISLKNGWVTLNADTLNTYPFGMGGGVCYYPDRTPELPGLAVDSKIHLPNGKDYPVQGIVPTTTPIVQNLPTVHSRQDTLHLTWEHFDYDKSTLSVTQLKDSAGIKRAETLNFDSSDSLGHADIPEIWFSPHAHTIEVKLESFKTHKVPPEFDSDSRFRTINRQVKSFPLR